MLELYHHGSSVCAAKVRFALAEKGLEWKGHYIDILKGDQFTPEYRAINPKAVVPTLVHDGHILPESTLICEYLDEAFPDRPLKPATAVGRHAMRMWTKVVDEQFHTAVGSITFVACHRHIIRRMSKADQEAFLNATPQDSVYWEWRDRKRRFVEQGFYAAGVADLILLYDNCLQRVEEALAHGAWLAGDTFSLADIGVTPYVNRLDMLQLSFMWERDRPRLTNWWNRIKSRPTFKPALLDWCPPDLTNDLKTYGAMSKYDVEKILDRN